jgi:hypothetical protein
MEIDNPTARPSRNRAWLLGVSLLATIAIVTAVGLFAGKELRPRSTNPERFRPEDLTDDEWADVSVYQSLPEKQEIESLGLEANRRFVRKDPPLFNTQQFDRILVLIRHSNFSVRLQATYLLTNYHSFRKFKPFDTDPSTQHQIEIVHGYAAEKIEDSSSYLRGWAFNFLGGIEDDRFINQASIALHSPSKPEREGAEQYLLHLAKRKPAGN